MQLKPIGVAAMLCLALAGHAAAEVKSGMSEAAYATAKKGIEAQAKADARACKRARGHARDLCRAQAKGREDAERAKLEARYRPDPEREQDAKVAVAKANYGVAKVRCAPLQGRREDRCLDQAKAAREAAERQARVEKVDRTGGIFGRDDGGKGKGAKS